MSNKSIKHKVPEYELLKQSDLVVYRDVGETSIGIVLSLNANNDWWGGGYYNVFWNDGEKSVYEREVAYEEMHRWKLADLVKVFPAPNNI